VPTLAPRPRLEEWGDLRHGDEVTLRGERGTFQFLAVAIDDDGSILWVDLVGGTTGRHAIKAVKPERVKVPTLRALEMQRRAREAKREAGK
jgi:mannose/fructose-specific phosphotransferase system component IIA